MANGKERVRVGGRELVVTNLDKIMYPETGTTKADVLAYYAAVAPVLIPAALNRPATRKRWVHGVGTAHSWNVSVLVSNIPILLARNSANQRRSCSSM